LHRPNLVPLTGPVAAGPAAPNPAAAAADTACTAADTALTPATAPASPVAVELSGDSKEPERRG